MIFLKRQRGAAIIVALFVTSLVAIAAIAMIERIRIDMRKTTLLFNQQQAYFYAQGAVTWAKVQLRTNWKNKKPGAIIDTLPLASAIDHMGAFAIKNILLDAQSYFNVNTVNNDNGQQFFARLLQRLDPTLPPTIVATLAAEMRLWISPNNNLSADRYYQTLTPPYRAAHQPMASISELRLLKGMTPSLFEKLQRVTIALPENTALNINTADSLLLLALNPGASTETIMSWIAHRKEAPASNTSIFANANTVALTTESNYFLLQTNVTVATQSLIFYTLLKRDIKNNQPMITVVWQTQGTL